MVDGTSEQGIGNREQGTADLGVGEIKLILPHKYDRQYSA